MATEEGAKVLAADSCHEPAGAECNLRSQFQIFSKFGDPKADGKSITLSQSDKWMKQAGVIDGKRITTTDTGICFKKFKSQKLNFSDWEKYVEELAVAKKTDVNEMKAKLIHSGSPGVHVRTGAASGVYDRLTDTHKYTGTHKERFDESGKGKGLEGRRDDAGKEGYVTGYKNKDTFDKSH